MILKSVEPCYFGPFREGARLDVDKNVTVVTGANDAGKTSLLRLIRAAFDPSPSYSATESDVNRSQLLEASKPWQSDERIGVRIGFEISEPEDQRFLKLDRIVVGTNISTKFKLAPKLATTDKVRACDVSEVSSSRGPRHYDAIGRMPQVLYLESGQADSSSIELKMPNPFERAFIECAFGPDFEFNSFAAMSELVSEESLEVAQERLSSACRAALPKSLHYQFKLSRVPSEPAKLHVRASDAFGGRIPLQGRGAGAKKLIGLYLSLISFVRDTPCLVLLDEPENSLHADAQRALRGFLDSLGSRDGVQIIYSTHSPVMIDPQRADRVRLVLQRSLNGVAESVIDNKPYSENFRQVRASLGMSTTDTLLYSDVSLIVEGETEIVSLPILLMRLSTLDARFKSVGKWLADIHLINGLGDSFDKLCSVAKGFGVKPAVFLDGDKIKRLRESRFFTKHPDVPVVHLPEGVEIEQMVPMSLYIECVAAVHRLKSEEATKDTFLAWMQGCSDRWIEKLAFSKQVDSWLGAEFAVNLNKVQVMKRAAETVEIGSISHLDCLESVAQKVEELLNAK